MTFAHITGWGMAVPEKILTNDDLSKLVDTNDKWIRERTGIRERRIAQDGQTTASLALDASIKALQVANLRPTDIDLIICSTSTPEHIFPATACLVQDRIGATKAGAFDLSAACSGFIYALNMAAQSIRSRAIQNALVIGSETLSRFVNWQDRNTCILFGDGAGAFVLQASEMPGGVLSAVMHSDGSGGDSLILPAGGSKQPTTEATLQALELAGIDLDELNWIIPHQANIRIIEAAARGLKIPLDRFVINLDRYGNTSTASIPIAVVEAIEDGSLQPGDKVVLVGFGAGLTWGALAAEWTGPLPSERKVYPRRYRWWARIRSFLRRVTRFIEGLIWGRGS